jgi:hypothetical protein
MLERESQVLGVERDRPGDVFGLIAHSMHASDEHTIARTADQIA